MPVSKVVQQLQAERSRLSGELDRIDRALALLINSTGRRVRRRSAAKAARPRRRPRMTAAQRKAVSQRMKKYWAQRRKAES